MGEGSARKLGEARSASERASWHASCFEFIMSRLGRVRRASTPLWGVSMALLAMPCGAQATRTPQKPAMSAAQPDAKPDEHRLHWNFPRFRVWQYVAVGVQTAANLTIEFTEFPSRDETWRSALPLDLPVRQAIRVPTHDGRERAAAASDILWYTTQFYTVVIDSLVVPLVFDDFNTDVALQMTMINWQALGLTGIITRLAHHGSGRARPSMYGCSEEPGASFPCEPHGPGFFAGHVSMTTAGAALACAHHAALPIYGEGPAGAVTCVLLSASAVAVGVLRLAADRHWVSDVIVGHLVGAAVGFGLPWLLHYQEPLTPELGSLGITYAAWLPSATADSVSLSLIGAF
jgi:membrane-associated phospholipid phosphatase